MGTAAESGVPLPGPAERPAPRPDAGQRDRGLERVFLLRRADRPSLLWLLLASIVFHALFLAVMIPAFPINVRPRNPPLVIQVKTWNAPLEAPRAPAPSAAPRSRPSSPIGSGPPPPISSPAGLGPIGEAVPAPDPNLLFLNPDAIYVQKQPEGRERAKSKSQTPADPALDDPLRDLLDLPFLEGLPVAGSGEVTEPILIRSSRVEPRYPPVARQVGARARLVLQAVIFSDGSVGDIRVVESTGPQLGFEEAAIEAVSRWKYVPALRDGRAVDCLLTIVVEFTR